MNVGFLSGIKKVLFLAVVCQSLFLAGCEEKEGADPKKDFNPNGVLNKKNVGESARDLLSAEKFTKVIVEIQSAQGFEPTSQAVTNLKNFMEQRLNKPGGIILKQSSIPAPGKTSYTAADIAAIEDRNRKEFTRPDTMAIYFFFADSKYAEDKDNAKVLGVAYRNTSMALFERTIRDLSGGITQPERSKLETVVWQHELAHILGLVNAGTAMVTNHQDAPHGRHCTNSNCLMHYTVETGNVVQNLFGGNMPQLDANCLNDLRANGGK
ncbi:hypothetical protein [Adhaeribacter aquaticus]|uniref:hypothetical protein n=1 Tax=Adhaeribacter aquaticus TaxID=299567 RepID=UPI0003FDA0CD|nr:hypothetical protein [Adhaeribacter aquaticus]